MRRLGIRSVLILASVLASGCGAILDTAYSMDDGRFSESATQSSPTEHSEERMEYEVGADMQLQCFSRTRRIERRTNVTKTYEYRGGYEKSSYAGTAIADGLGAALVGGVMLGVCTSDENDVGCSNMLWAAPLAIDLVYSLVRYHTVGAPVLTDKVRSGDSLGYGEVPTQETATDCSTVESLWIGAASGPSQTSRLNSGGGERVLEDGALSIPIGDAQTGMSSSLQLAPEAAVYWSKNAWISLWARGTDGILYPVTVDRCTALRPHASAFDIETRQRFDQSCPLPTPGTETR